MLVPDWPNHRRSLDAVPDAFTDGRRFRVLTRVDNQTRECLALVVDTSTSGRRVARKLDAIFALYGRPLMVVREGSTEFTRRTIPRSSQDRGIDWYDLSPGKPKEHGFIERFNGRFRDECLHETLFSSRPEGRERIGTCKEDDHTQRPRS